MKDFDIFITIMGHPDFRGGGNTAAHNFAETFVRLGFNVTAFFLSPNGFLKTTPKTSYKLVLLKDSRIPIINCLRIAFAFRKKTFKFSAKKRIIISFGYEGLFVQKNGSVFIAASLAPLLRYMGIKELFSDWKYFLPSNLGRWLFLLSCYLDRLTKLKADFIQCLCKFSAEECLSVYRIPKEKIFIIPLGIDIKKFIPKSEVKEKTILFAGGSAEYKGLDILLKSFPAVIKKYPDVRLKIIGELNSKRTKELSDMTETLSVSSNIDWIGSVSQEEMATFYAKSYVLILPSRAESFLLAAIEGMACAIPIIATPVGVIPEIIINGVNGFIIKPEDSEGLSDIVIELFRDQEKAQAIGKAGRRTVEKMFFWESIGEQYITKLESFIKQ